MYDPTNQPHSSEVRGQSHWVLWRLSVNDLYIYLFIQLELYVRYNQRVMDPNTHRTTFWCDILWVLSTGCKWTFDIWMTALLSEMSIFCVKAGCETPLMSYAFQHTSQCLSEKTFVHIIYTHNLKTIGHIGTFSTLNNCSTIGDIPCVV